MANINVLVVDDSFFMRQAISRIIRAAGINVVGEAKNGREAIDKVVELKPDIVTMDIEMPEMNGIEAVKHIMNIHPVPILMLSTLTQEGAQSTMDALDAGAIDFITKRAAFREMDSIAEEIISKIKLIAGNPYLKQNMFKAKLLRKASSAAAKPLAAIKPQAPAPKAMSISQRTNVKIACLGISTGGPSALKTLFERLPGNFPVPLIIVQHMPEHFTKSLADRLNAQSQMEVYEAGSGLVPKAGAAYIAPGGRQLELNLNGSFRITAGTSNELFRPSVNVTMNALIKSYGKSILGVMMTGMGKDGLESFKILNQSGGYIICQDKESSTIAGMTGAIIDAGIANEICSLQKLAPAICKYLNVAPVLAF